MKHDPTLTEYAGEVLGGTTGEVAVKGAGAILAAALASLWGWASATGGFLLAYLVLILLDVGFGAALAVREKRRFDFSKLFSGPAKKLGLTAGLFLAAAVIDTVIPGTFILSAVAGFVCVAQFLDSAAKYGKFDLPGSGVAAFIAGRLGMYVGQNTKPNEQNGG